MRVQPTTTSDSSTRTLPSTVAAAAVFGLGIGLAVFWADGWAQKTLVLAANAIVAALVILLLSVTRARSRARWRAALERYTREELAKAAYPRNSFRTRVKPEAR